LWNVFKKEEAGEYLMNIINDESIKPPLEEETILTGRDYRIDLACNRLAVEAVKRGTTDNVTIMFIDISKINQDN
jgi:integrin-linked kinase-associated serine/threonine phosphatase 2C